MGNNITSRYLILEFYLITDNYIKIDDDIDDPNKIIQLPNICFEKKIEKNIEENDYNFIFEQICKHKYTQKVNTKNMHKNSNFISALVDNYLDKDSLLLLLTNNTGTNVRYCVKQEKTLEESVEEILDNKEKKIINKQNLVVKIYFQHDGKNKEIQEKIKELQQKNCKKYIKYKKKYIKLKKNILN
jgi:anion-transporting  ArsA/GET3 family ATPase